MQPGLHSTARADFGSQLVFTCCRGQAGSRDHSGLCQQAEPEGTPGICRDYSGALGSLLEIM